MTGATRTVTPDLVQCQRHLRALFAGKPDDLYVLIWSVVGQDEDRLSAWFTNVDEAAAYAVRIATHKNTYVEVSLSPQDFGQYRRCSEQNAAGLVGLFVEIDFSHPVHKKTNLPPTVDDALALAREFPLPPTIILLSAHGIHAWWLFREPWLFANEGDRAAAKNATIRLQATLRAKAETRGWTIDSTADLARVLRVAGTLNHKDEIVRVEILEIDERRRYDPSDFEPYLLAPAAELAETIRLTAPSNKVTRNGHSDANGHPNVDDGKARLSDDEILITAAREAGPRFAALFDGTWAKLKGRKRKDGVFDPELPVYESQHNADLALCEILSYYAADAVQLDRLFRKSKLMRPKWDEKHYATGETYGAHTINLALAHAADPITAYAPPSNPDRLTGEWKKNGHGADGVPAPFEDRSWPEPPGEVAFAGLAGQFVDALLPHTEADPVALLLSFLVAFTIAVGSAPHCIVGATRHALRLFVVLVGRSAKARKGDSAQATLRVFSEADPDWTDRRVVSGLSSGEGLIWAVRDPIQKSEPVREKGHVKGFEIVTADPGETDKRLLVLESEFARVLTTMSRQGNTLSPVIRQAWDSGDLRVLTKTNAAKATGAHIGVLAHITEEELRRELSDTETVNGFANRLLFAVVRRSKLLPEPEPFTGAKAADLARAVSERLIWSRTVGQIDRSPSAKDLWADVYADLSEERPGLFGALSARAEAHCLRLSAIYALLDQSMVIQPAHIDSALELWGYVDRSMHYLFGNATGDPVADTILAALRANGDMTRTQISDLFGRHETAGRIEHALRLLLTAGLAVSFSRETTGRPVEVWRTA